MAITAFSMPGPMAATKASARISFGIERKTSVIPINTLSTQPPKYPETAPTRRPTGAVITATATESGATGTATITVAQAVASIDVSDPGGAFVAGATVQLTATADPGWTFGSWSGDLSSTANPASLTMDGDKTVTATFIQDDYILTVNVVGNGSIAANPDQMISVKVAADV